MIVVPTDNPVTRPEPDPTVATVGTLLVQNPPDTVSPNAVVLPAHTDESPVIGVGAVTTFTVVTA